MENFDYLRTTKVHPFQLLLNKNALRQFQKCQQHPVVSQHSSCGIEGGVGGGGGGAVLRDYRTC